jgi:RNA polymerase sigma-70 factor (ECF subfamily)
MAAVHNRRRSHAGRITAPTRVLRRAAWTAGAQDLRPARATGIKRIVHLQDTDAHAPEPESPPTPELVAILASNHRQFLAFLERRVGSRAIAEDILQDAFVRSLERLEHLRNEESVVAWFYRVLRNAVIDAHRRHATASRGLTALAAELEQQTGPGTAGPGTEIRGAICQCVGQLAATLKPEYADALERIEIHGIAVKDYAAEAGISSGNAAVRVFRARAALRKQVSRSCGTCAEHGCLDCTCSGPACGEHT